MKGVKNIKDILMDKGNTSPATAIQKLHNYDIIAGSDELSGEAFTEVSDVWILKDCLDEIKDDYDFVILDSAPGRSKIMDMEFRAADYVISPTEADSEAESGLYKIRRDLDMHTKHGESNVKFLGVFMNRYKNNSNLHKLMYENLKDIEEEIGCKRFNTTIRETVKAGEARLGRMAISEYAKNSGIAKDFSDLVDEIIDRIVEEETNDK